MGFDGKYGKVTTEHGDIPEDEPVFIFRGRDRLLPELLTAYAQQCAAAGTPQRHLDIVQNARERIRTWQQANPGRVRTPDSERSRNWPTLDG